MAISIVDWENELSFAKKDEKVGIKIATLSESQDKGTYTSLPDLLRRSNPEMLLDRHGLAASR